MEKYLVIDPDGTFRVTEIDRAEMLEGFHQAIGCEMLENVRTIISGVCLIVDDSGKAKEPPKQINETASRLYMGWLCGNDYIAGPVILAAIGTVDGEPDWVPLNAAQLTMLRKLGFKIPDEL